MSEYTPTTAEIVNAWRYFRTENRDFDGDAEAEVRFWLAAHDAEVRKSVDPEMAMPCADTKPHSAHVWQMSATGFCLCAGVVTEEPEWEYGVTTKRGMHEHPYLDGAERYAAAVRDEIEHGRVSGDLTHYGRVMKRTKAKAGPWVPVKQEGAETDG